MSEYTIPELTPEEIIKQQDELIGNLTRRVKAAEETVARINSIRDRQKEQAGFHTLTSFDDVWNAVLKAYLETKK